MSIKIFKLLTGQEFIGDVADESQGLYTVRRALALRFYPGEQEIGVDFHLLVPSAPDAVLEIFEHSLMCKPIEAPSTLESAYISATSGIIVPESTPKILHS